MGLHTYRLSLSIYIYIYISEVGGSELLRPQPGNFRRWSRAASAESSLPPTAPPPRCFLAFGFFGFWLLAFWLFGSLVLFGFWLLARAAPPRENLAVQHCTLAGFRPCRKKGDFEEERWLRWEITFVMTVCDAESIGVVFARARTPNQKKRFLPIDDACIGGPLAKFFFRIFVFLLKNCFFRAFQKWKNFESIGKCLYFEKNFFFKNFKISRSCRKNEKKCDSVATLER